MTFERGATSDLVTDAGGPHSEVRSPAFSQESEFLHDLRAHIAAPDASRREDPGGWRLRHTVPGRTAGIRPSPNGEAKAVVVSVSPPAEHDRSDRLAGDASSFATLRANSGTSTALPGAYRPRGRVGHLTRPPDRFPRYEERRGCVAHCRKFALGGIDSTASKSRTVICGRDFTLCAVPRIPGVVKPCGDLQGIADAVSPEDRRPRSLTSS